MKSQGIDSLGGVDKRLREQNRKSLGDTATEGQSLDVAPMKLSYDGGSQHENSLSISEKENPSIKKKFLQNYLTKNLGNQPINSTTNKNKVTLSMIQKQLLAT